MSLESERLALTLRSPHYYSSMFRIIVLFPEANTLQYVKPLLERLCMRGHELHLSFQRLIQDEYLEELKTLCRQYPKISIGMSPPRFDGQNKAVRQMRRAIDYVSQRLLIDKRKRRQATRGNGNARLQIARMRICRGLEKVLPPSPIVLSYLHQLDADIVLITDLAKWSSSEVDYIKACQSVAIPTSYIAISHDFFTREAAMTILPKKICVWSRQQIRAAMEVHGVSNDVLAFSDPPFWGCGHFLQSQAPFRNSIGIDAEHPYILFVCSEAALLSSELERKYFEQWLQLLQSTSHIVFQRTAVVVLVHPSNSSAWKRGFAGGESGMRVVVCQKMENEYSETLCNALQGAAAIVGLNVEAMMESALVGAPPRKFSTSIRSTSLQDVPKISLSHYKALAHMIEKYENYYPIDRIVDFSGPNVMTKFERQDLVCAIESLGEF